MKKKETTQTQEEQGCDFTRLMKMDTVPEQDMQFRPFSLGGIKLEASPSIRRTLRDLQPVTLPLPQSSP